MVYDSTYEVPIVKFIWTNSRMVVTRGLAEEGRAVSV